MFLRGWFWGGAFKESLIRAALTKAAYKLDRDMTPLVVYDVCKNHHAAFAEVQLTPFSLASFFRFRMSTSTLAHAFSISMFF